jgi:tRNA (adenine22-N1)-methyltransferase
MVKLSQRLQMIADRVPQGSRLADIGSDHALLPTFLVQQGVVPSAVAGEVNPGPLEAAAKQVREAGLTDQIEVRLGDGLEVLQPGEVDIVTIAGMGGSLIASILEAGKAKLSGVSRLILQPNVGEEQVRRWLVKEGWLLTGEQILEEDGKIYEILCALKADNVQESNRVLYQERLLGQELRVSKDRLLMMGPFLMEEASRVWFRKWESELQKLEMIRGQLGQSASEASKLKAEELVREMAEIREVLECLQKAKQ